MRVTNSMVSSQMMLNINKNANKTNTLYARWASQKQIQFPSEDPIRAARILKFRTTLSENKQYQRNVEQGQAWMDVTNNGQEEAKDILKNIRDLVAKADGVETLEDKKSIMTEIESLREELAFTMNGAYTNRYLFSGYRTDEPAYLVGDDANLTYRNIEQNFVKGDKENTIALENTVAPPGLPSYVSQDISTVKLAYKNLYETPGGVGPYALRVSVDGVPVPAGNITFRNKDDVGAYSPAANEIFYIRETGEMILGANHANYTTLDVDYDKIGFEKGEPNPKVYFNCDDNSNPVKHYSMNNQDIEYEFGTGLRISVNSLAKDTVTDKLYADVMNLCDTILNTKPTSLEDLMVQVKLDFPAYDEDQVREEAEKRRQIETGHIDKMTKSRFSNMLTRVDNHAAQLSRTQTDLGTRANRLELIKVRLEFDEESYTKLLGDNEDADMIETAMDLSNAESAYQASMQIGMNIMRTTLVNYL